MTARRLAAAALALLLAAAAPFPHRAVSAQTPAGNAFTYQGVLESASGPVSGARYLKFRLYTAATGGSQVGPEIQAPGLTITEGRFAAQLDFGAPEFLGQARWLEIDVSNDPAGTTFTTLAPRQPLTAAPYALYALNGPAGPQGPAGPAGPTEIVATVNAQFSLDDRVGWTRIEDLSDDLCLNNIPLGFNFTGWGRTVSSVSLSSNGVLFFGQACSAAFTNGPLPAGISPDPFLTFFWDDLRDFGTGEFAEYATFGTPGGRVFNLFFRNRLFSSVCGSLQLTAMISIHEGSNLIKVNYSTVNGCPNLRGSNGTFGLQGPGGALATSFFSIACDSPILDDNNPAGQSISFVPPRQ